MTLHLAVGPKLLHRKSSTDQWTDVTRVAHRYLFEPLTLEPDVKTADLLGLILPNPILLEVFGRWDLQSSLQRSADELKEIGAAAIPASTSADKATLGTVLEDLVYDLTFFGTPEREQALAREYALQEWSEVTAQNAEELLREIEQATMDAGPATDRSS